MTTYYKVLGENGECFHGGVGEWPLPRDKRPGKWMPEIAGRIEACRNGYHLVTASQLIEWLGPTLWVAEGKGDTDVQTDKTAFRKARLISQVTKWNERTARIFACDCAERSLHLFEKAYPNDKRPRTAIEVARRFVEGKATKEERAAARAAAWAAARAAAWAAARDAAWAAGAAARAAARDAAWDARDAAWDARAAAWDARAAARDAERGWQVNHLCELLGLNK